MVYTRKEKQKIDSLLMVFGDYLATNKNVDIAYSEKSGYVRLIIDECADSVFFKIESFDDMLEMFFYDVLSDEVDAAWRKDPNLTNQTMDYSIPYKRLKVYVDVMGPEREYAQKKLDTFITFWKNHEYLP